MGRLGDYEIETELGRGSMGVVYLAHDPRLQRRVALKTIHVPDGVDPAEIDAFRERFLREAQAAGGISHPGIVTIYGVDESADQTLPFISMEYVPGPSLRQILKDQGRLDPQRAFRICDALADALYSAHSAGVVHRDIKPANVLVREPDEVVKIADFGVAHLTLNELTRSGEMVGSPAYMAPEQIREGQADERSDLFALGVMLYEMLCGERPFEGHDMPSIVHRVVYTDPLPITQRVDGLPGVINAFFDRALAKSPRDRFQSAAEFRHALNDVQLEYQIGHTGDLAAETEVLTETLSQAREVDETTGRHRLRQLVVFVAMFAIFIVGWAVWRGSSAPDPVEAASTATGGSQPIPQTPVVAPATESALDVPVPEVLGESVLTPAEGGVDLDAAAVEPPVVEPQAAPPPAPKRAAPAKPEPAPARPETTVAEVAEALDAAGKAAAEAAEQAAPEEPAAAPEPVVEPAQLNLITRSSFKAGTLTVFVDGEETMTLDLASGSKAVTRFYKRALSRGTRREEGALELEPGAHTILVRATRPGKDKVIEASLDVELAEGELRDLVIVAGRMFRSGLALKLE